MSSKASEDSQFQDFFLELMELTGCSYSDLTELIAFLNFNDPNELKESDEKSP
ncbi:hypothetical protein [Prochlorococcus marinus]|uniref:hypothetical protein n=1 Tax=Prochlorococcus marinus TaxID=1219 RepID=UPI0022B40C7D|nr:hypothetical protein [Prochlorococcus marinus]